MAVDIGGHSNRRMAEYLTDDLDLDSLGEHQARRGVAKFVGMPITQAGVATDLLKLTVEVPRVDWRTDRSREDVSGSNPRTSQPFTLNTLALLVIEERLQHFCGQVDRASTQGRLGVRRDKAAAFALELP